MVKFYLIVLLILVHPPCRDIYLQTKHNIPAMTSEHSDLQGKSIQGTPSGWLITPLVEWLERWES